MKILRTILLALGGPLFALSAQAQTYEIKSGTFNSIFVAPSVAPVGSNQASVPATPNSNFQGVGPLSGSTGPVSTSAVHGDRYAANPAKTIVLPRGSFGGTFASGTPLYFMGDEITPPLVDAAGQDLRPGGTEAEKLAAARLYWRPQPVLPGENLPLIGGILTPLGTATVTSADPNGINNTTVIVAASPAPAGLLTGATLLGQPITKISGSGPFTVTLAGKPNETIAGNTARPVTPASTFYYSRHAEKVFAAQPGQVTMTWVTVGLNLKLQETFIVSGTTQRPIRTIYWTDGSFNGPIIQIADARITTVNPVYYSTVPKAVPQEVSIPGYTPVIPSLATLYFEKFNGTGQLRAYNVEGRIFIEYLGNVRSGDVHESLGTDVVEIKRQPDVVQVAQHLGTELIPRVPQQPGDELLTASPVLNTNNGGASFYGTSMRPDGSQAYYAERETSPANNPDDGEPASSNAYNKVIFYWMESPPDNFGIRWPKFQTRYWQRWSPHLADYAHYTVDPSGSTAATGLSFQGGSLPTLVWQDDPAQAEASIDVTTQRLTVAFAPTNPSRRNRSLLKFTSGGSVWYVNLYSQAENRQIQVAAQVSTRPGPPGFNVSTYDSNFGDSLLAPISNLLAATPGASFVSTDSINYENNFNLPGITAGDTFSVLWQGWFDVGRDGPGDYTFGTNSDDGSVIYLDLNGDGDFDDAGELIVDNNGAHAPQESTGTINLAGGPVRIAIGFYEDGGGEVMHAKWKKGANLPFASLDTIEGSKGPFSTSVTGVELASTVGLEVGMVVSSGGLSGNVTRILDGRRIEISQPGSAGVYDLTLTVQSDQAAPINTTATVGTRLTAPAGHEEAGYISGGKGYYPAGYLNPFVSGVAVANAGAIIPVNALAADNVLTVRWFKKVTAPGADFRDLYVPGKTGRYTVSFPAATSPRIVIAEGVGTGDLDPEVIAGSLYYQNDRTQPGYNPNEEHAVMIGTRAYAVRDDLNMIAPPQSQPFVLIGYTNPADQRPDMKVYQVVREVDEDGDRADAFDILFDRPAIAGNLLVAPYPLPLMPLPFIGTECQNREVTPPAGLDPRINLAGTPADWDSFTKKDRKGFHWIFRGPHDGTSTSKRIAMQYQYVSRPGFFLPNAGGTGSEIAEGTLLPFLRPLVAGVPQGDPVTGTPLTVNFIPAWPANAAELRVGETLALSKFGLPQVRGQLSAEVFYQQSMAIATAQPSVTLHDPTREKTIQLSEKGLDTGLPESIATTSQLGKLYFQRLAPDLQERIWFDPLRSPNREKRPGTLVLVGGFKDEIAGEDYLHLNVLTAAQIAALKALCTEPAPVKTNWDATIDALSTKVETFMENPQRLGTYIPDPARTVQVGEDALTKVTDAETAVDSYAVTATGEAAGWVTMIFGNGEAFTPEGDPVQVKVFKVAPTLYTGELKTLYSRNPLDEQVSLRHTGDFAARPQDYEFEWKWAPASATAPATYTTSWSQRLGVGTSDQWSIVRNPAGALPSVAEYAGATALPFPRSIAIKDAAYAYDPVKQNPGLVLINTLPAALDFTNGGVPGEIVFSATMGDLDGFVLYVNGNVALANRAPVEFVNTDAVTGLVPRNQLPRQFRIPRSFFTAALNRVEIALFTGADAKAPAYLDFRLDVTQEVDVVASTFQSVSDSGPVQKNTNVATISADSSLPFGGSTFVLNDRWYTMRYRPRQGVVNVAGTGYSRWMSPQLVEGWIKRVLREINPFEQRVKDLFNNGISTDTSVLTQAGTRWEGDIALTLDNIESVGLIAIYETVLNRARSMSIDANTNDPDTNQALMLAAGYLSDLYTLLGHEAYADAANPTISTDDADGTTEINSSRFSFENQVSSSLTEELALLRGRDASGTRVDVSPAYNRLYWNFTGGINAGEALYATNYNVKEKAGSSTADGVIDAADAQRMFPQGHGDAYGHYLTALKGYYRLLSSPNFSWQRRAEAVLVLGQAVTVDFVDERKFAGDASYLAQAAEQICALTYRQQYKDGAPGWSQFRDTATAPNTTEKRNWGLDEWASRSAQGAYYHWVVGNAMLPDVDTYHTGVEKIDRTTVPELNELSAALTSFQTTADNASARLNPLGLSPGAIQFDIDSTFLEVGSTAGIGDNAVQGMGHFDQIRERAMKTLNNAAGAFQQAARMTRSLRNQDNQVDDYNSAIVDQERTFRNQLIEIYGRPYEGDVGPGKTYAQGYYGPDLHQWFVVDRPNALVDTTVSDGVKFRIWKVLDREFNIPELGGDGLIKDYDIYKENGNVVRENVEVTAYPNQFIQYSDVWLPGLGARPETGELQGALLEAHRSFLVLKDGLYNVKVLQHRFLREGYLLKEAIESHQQHLASQEATQAAVLAQMSIQVVLDAVATAATDAAEAATITSDAVAEALPGVNGLDNDFTSVGRGLIKTGAGILWVISKTIANISASTSRGLNVAIAGQEMSLQSQLDAIGFSHEEKQQAYELENLYRDLTTQEYALAHPLAAYQAANERVASVLGRGLRIQEERTAFRQRAAAVVQGYRTKDVTFRVFRNEALEQYRSLFDLASRYTYMTAKAYDYETGLLGTTEGQAFISSIVASRSLGDVRDGDVFATVSSLGDNGLAGSMAKMHADHEVAEGRLGINNPEIYSTLFSLRGELFRILDDPNQTADDEAWQQTLEQFFKANLLTDPDVAALCRSVKRPDGRPVPGIIIPFSTTIQHGLNFFGLPLAAGDHAFTATNFSTKIQSLGIALPGYVGMDEYASGDATAGTPALTDPDALAATPYLYVIPTGSDYMYAPPLGNELFERSWLVEDQAIPLPFNIGASAFNSTQIFNANGTLSERPWVIRQHQAFRPVADPAILLGGLPTEFTSHRLVGRSVWNSGWKIVIPAYTLLNNEQEGLSRFARTVRDVRIFIRSYSYSGN